MVVTVNNIRIAYFPVPKVANTSMKHLLHKIKTGGRFVARTDEETGAVLHIHKEYKTPKFSTIKPDDYLDLFRIAIVRDPIDRVVSAWRNRVMHHRELEGKVSSERLAALGLSTSPDLSLFVERLEDYRKANKSIAIHTDSLTEFLGEDSRYYNLIFNMADSAQIETFFSALTGKNIKLPRKQTGGPPANRDELSGALVRKLEDIYRRDYDVFGAFLENPPGPERIVELAEGHKASLSREGQGLESPSTP